MLDKVDELIICGGMAFTFKKVLEGVSVILKNFFNLINEKFFLLFKNTRLENLFLMKKELKLFMD